MQSLAVVALAAVAAVAAILVSPSIVGTNNVFVGKKKLKNQANTCDNSELPIDVSSRNINSQIQGEKNSAGLSEFQRQ